MQKALFRLAAGDGPPQQTEGPPILTVTIEVDAPEVRAREIREDLAMYLERWGDARVVSVAPPPRPDYRQIVMDCFPKR